MDPGRGHDPEDPSEGPAPWSGGRSRDLGDRVSDLERSGDVPRADFRHMGKGIVQLSSSLEFLTRERRDAGAELERQIKELGKELAVRMDALDKRIVSFETERAVWIRMFKLGITISGIGVAIWKFFGETILTITRLFKGAP